MKHFIAVISLAIVLFAMPSRASTPLHDVGAKLARDFVCEGSPSCLRRAGDRLTRAAHVIVDVCLAEPSVPKWMCLGFVAAISNEGGGLEHPTCGGLKQSCVLRCDELRAGGGRQSCFLQCAIDQGIKYCKPKHCRWQRIKRCNDKGWSRGPFQQKPGSVEYCGKLLNDPDYDPHSLPQSARCTMRKVTKLTYRKRWPCPKDAGNRWAITMKRVGKGPQVTIQKEKPRTWIPYPTGGGRWEEKKPAIRRQQCAQSGYALRGLNYYKKCGKPCREVERPVDSPARGKVAEGH